MSGYNEPDKNGVCKSNGFGEFDFSHHDGKKSFELLSNMLEDDERLQAVQRFAALAVQGSSVEARAVLCQLMSLDLNDPVLREGIVNGQGGLEAYFRRMQFVDLSRELRDAKDDVGWIAMNALAGYFPPESSDSVITTLDPYFDWRHQQVEEFSSLSSSVLEYTLHNGG